MFIRLTLLVLLLVSVPFTSLAQEGPAGDKLATYEQCAPLLKECFTESGIKKTNCFYSTAKHPFCEGSQLGELAFKRWSLAADTTVGGQTPPGLLGPSLYDEKCISGCDIKWIGNLVAKKDPSQSMSEVQSCLDSCELQNPLEMLHP
ncbi:MAG: hypothetical protein KDD53_02965 [Bdellovibrionales bacterium]|nr:hypothetical protein [Bdellovibrionales bacterium]